MKKELSLSKNMFLNYAVGGAAWIITGISGMFEYMLADIVGIVALTIALGGYVYTARCKLERSDERSEENEMWARATVQKLIMFSWLMIALVLHFVPNDWFAGVQNWPDFLKNILMIFLGAEELLLAALFILKEKE